MKMIKSWIDVRSTSSDWNTNIVTASTTNTKNIIEYTKEENKEVMVTNSSKKRYKEKRLPKLKNIDFQPPLTVAIWDDGTKTFVKCFGDEEFDPEKGAAMAIAKKFLGNNYHYADIINPYIERYYKKHPELKK